MPHRTLLFAGALLFAFAPLCSGQISIQPEPQRKVYTVRIVNGTGRPVCMKIEGHGKSRSFHTDLRARDSARQTFYGGLRVVMVWDDETGGLLLLDTLNFDRSGVLRLPAVAPAAAAGPAAARAAASQALQIEPGEQ